MNTTSTTYGIRLTRREKEILQYIKDGMSTREIAGLLYISENTVANHRKNMLKKKGAKTSGELAARQNNLKKIVI